MGERQIERREGEREKRERERKREREKRDGAGVRESDSYVAPLRQ